MATINDAPECLNTNDRAMWCLGFNEAQLLIKALTAERDKLKSYLLESKNALEDANGLYFSTYTTESQSPYDILINKLGKLL